MTHFIDYDKALLIKLIALKAVTLCMSCLVTVTVYFYFDVELPYDALAITLTLSTGLLAAWCVRLKFRFPVSEYEIFMLLVTDVVILYFLVDQSGGSANPFTSSLLVPLALSAALLRKRYSLCVVLLAVLMYANWTFGGNGHEAHMDHSKFSLHLYGMWINFLLSAIILFVFVTYATDSVRNREVQLQKAREKILRDEQLVAVATLTATTAHALGTPLSTMSILADEWERDGQFDSERNIFKEQLAICKKYLASIGSATKTVETSEAVITPIFKFFDELQDHFQLLRPTDELKFSIGAEVKDNAINLNRSLFLALVNLIENALQSGSRDTSVEFTMNNGHVQIKITDDGEGIDDSVKDKIGKTFISSKTEGWGLGVYLSNSTIEQFQGKISMLDRPTGGTITIVELPCVNNRDA